MNDWLDLEHQLWKDLKDLDILDKKILVGFSGGVDSLALLWALFRVKKTGLEACYVHHGEENDESRVYRTMAEEFCQKFCLKHQIPFTVQKNTERILKSEAELREFRHQALEETRQKIQADFIALAHHRDDLLETRLLRLIRGTGPQGLGSMKALQGELWRPFLKINKKDLQNYLENFQIKALEDPSNEELQPFRNWLRQEWLVALEKRQAGAVHSLGRSLEILAESFEEDSFLDGLFQEEFISRSHYLALSKAQQKRALAHYLLSQKVRNFSQSHLEEIQKRLDISQKDFIFRVSGVEWVINAQQIRVQKTD